MLAALACASLPLCAALQPAAGLPADAAAGAAAASAPPASTPPAACAGRAECEPERWLREQQALNRVIVLARAHALRAAMPRRHLTRRSTNGQCAAPPALLSFINQVLALCGGAVLVAAVVRFACCPVASPPPPPPSRAPRGPRPPLEVPLRRIDSWKVNKAAHRARSLYNNSLTTICVCAGGAGGAD